MSDLYTATSGEDIVVEARPTKTLKPNSKYVRLRTNPPPLVWDCTDWRARTLALLLLSACAAPRALPVVEVPAPTHDDAREYLETHELTPPGALEYKRDRPEGAATRRHAGDLCLNGEASAYTDAFVRESERRTTVQAAQVYTVTRLLLWRSATAEATAQTYANELAIAEPLLPTWVWVAIGAGAAAVLAGGLGLYGGLQIGVGVTP